jgi:hypothetical protein
MGGKRCELFECYRHLREDLPDYIRQAGLGVDWEGHRHRQGIKAAQSSVTARVR